MKKSVIIILVAIIFISCQDKNEIILSKHENGQTHELLTLNRPITKDSIGVKTIFFETGELQCEGGYKKGRRDGEWICYHRNKKVKWKGTYKKGEENGNIYCQYEDGSWKKLRSENGKREGQTIEYNFDSTRNQFFYTYGRYENDLETGLWIWKDTTEQTMKEINYEEGVNIGYFAFYYPNGNIKTKGQGFREGENDYISMKDTLYFYNENENEKIDSMEIYEGGRLKKTIRKEN